MASNQAVKVDVVDNKKNKGKKLADKSIRAFVDVDKVKDLIGGGGGQGGESMIANLEDYMDLGTLTLTDVEGVKEAINAGKAFYLNLGGEGTGLVLDGFYNGAVDGDNIIITSAPMLTEVVGGEGGALTGIKFYFDATTGIIDYTKPSLNVFAFPHSTVSNANRNFALGKLSITSGSDTYEYDGSQDVDIDISSGSGGGTYVYPLGFTKGDDDTSSGGGAYWDDLLNAITNDIPIAVEYYLSSDVGSLPAKCVTYVNSVRDTGEYTQGGGRIRKFYLSVRCAGTSKTDPCVDQLITVARYYDQGDTVETTVDVIS